MLAHEKDCKLNFLGKNFPTKATNSVLRRTMMIPQYSYALEMITNKLINIFVKRVSLYVQSINFLCILDCKKKDQC